MTHHLFIAEKPSLAKAIAEARAEQRGVKASKSDGCWQVGDDRVTWFFGHMFEMAAPEEYAPHWKKWDLATLPISAVDGWKLTPKAEHKAHLKRFSELLKGAAVVVNCGDAAREGQLLVDQPLAYYKRSPFGPDVKRLWVSSMSRKDMIAALESLLPNADKQPLSQAGETRQRADWLVGMNLTRAYTLHAQAAGYDLKSPLSIGRVQTPTLRIVVDRDRDRDTFKPTDHFLPRVTFRYENAEFSAALVISGAMPGTDAEGRLTDKSIAQQAAQSASGKTGEVTHFEATDKTKTAPLPFSLSALQTECSARLGLTAQQTLDVAQALYETHKVATYPRSDSRYLPTSILSDEAPGILSALANSPGYEVAGQADPTRKTKVWDDAKISDHHAIIPTDSFSAEKLEKLSDIERNVFDIIARSFIAQFLPDCRYQAVSALVECAGHVWKATGRTIKEEGWKAVVSAPSQEDEDAESHGEKLPAMKAGDVLLVIKTDVSAKRTSPPAAFTDGTLIASMSAVHKLVNDPSLKAKLRETSGIGTEATRAGIIETLIARGDIARSGKALVSTPLGRAKISALAGSDIADPATTARWEDALSGIAAGTTSAAKFLAALEQRVKAELARLSQRGVVLEGVAKRPPKPEMAAIPGHGGICPECGKGTMTTRVAKTGKHAGKSFLGCSTYPKCQHSIWSK